MSTQCALWLVLELTLGNKPDYLYQFWVRIYKTLTSAEIMHAFQYFLFPHSAMVLTILFISLLVTLEWNVLSSEAMKCIIKCHMLALPVIDVTSGLQQGVLAQTRLSALKYWEKLSHKKMNQKGKPYLINKTPNL